MDDTKLTGFNEKHEEMIRIAFDALMGVGYEVARFKELMWVEDMPSGYRAMCLSDGAALGIEAFASQEMLNHVLEEEYLHLIQKSRGIAESFSKGTARYLEHDVDESRQFPVPE
jgi:hypothetical protein